MVTIRQIAQEAGVSIGTVDRVLHNRGAVKQETKSRVEEAVKKLNYSPNMVAQGLALQKKKIRILFLVPDATYNPFFADVYEGARKKAEELRQYNVKVKFVRLTFNEKREVALSISGQQMAEELEKASGLATMGLSVPELGEIFSYMEKAKKPVVIYNDSAGIKTDFLAYVGCNYVHSGRLAAGLCNLIGGAHAKIVVYSQSINDREITIQSYDGRMKGLKEELAARYPDMRILCQREVSFNPIDNYISAQKMIAEYPDVDVVYVVNPGDYSICDAIRRVDSEHRIKIITNDIVESNRKMIEEQAISAVICQEPQRQGAESLDILFRNIAFGAIPEEKFCYTDLSIHIAQNL